MRRYKGLLAYDGTAYAGSQRQQNAPSIQAALEDALATVTGAFTPTLFAGRTDAGVHASGQVIAFDCDWRHEADALLKALNAHLPPDIALHALEVTSSDFHPRYAATRREYVYQLYSAPVRNPLWDRYWWHVRYMLNEAAMQAAAHTLIGVHDFATFGQPTVGTVTIREVFRSDFALLERDGGAQAARYRFTIAGNAFLKHMVRSIVGTLVEVGRGRLSPTDFEEALASADRQKAGATAPPHGLTLVHIEYGGGTLPSEMMSEE